MRAYVKVWLLCSEAMSDTTRYSKRHWLLRSGEKKKEAFCLQTHQMDLVQTGIQCTPCPRLNMLLDL